MTSIEGISDLHMSGTRAVFSTEGEPIDEAVIAAAFEARGMELVSYTKERRPHAEAVVLVGAGVT